MRRYLVLFIVVQVLSLCVSAQEATLNKAQLPCSTEKKDPSQPWVNNSKILDSFPKENPLPRFVGTFRDQNQSLILHLYHDAKGVFGELSSPALDADSPTSRLYGVAFNSRTGSLQFAAKFFDGQLQFTGMLRGSVIKATFTRNNRTEMVILRRERDPATEEVFFTSRAQFDCAMTLWNRF